MKIDEKANLLPNTKGFMKNLVLQNDTQKANKDEGHFSHQFSPFGQAGGFHLLCY